jgi:hypothetical protein
VKGFRSPSYEIMSLIETPSVNYAPEPCELVLQSLFVAKTHTAAPSCLDSAWRVLLPFFHYNDAQDTGCPWGRYRPWVLATW